jgi:hypothetical protein
MTKEEISMVYTALVSAHIYRDEDGNLDIEVFNHIDNDEKATGIFDDVDHAILDQVEPEFDFNEEYFFITVVESRFVEYDTQEGREYAVEHDVRVIKRLSDLPQDIEPTAQAQAD